MTPTIRCFALILMGFIAVLLGSCNRDKLSSVDKNSSLHKKIEENSTAAEKPDTISNPTPIIDDTPYKPTVNLIGTETTASTSPKQSKAKTRNKKETLYISTYGANGEVWGHVTMNGNTGRGTIHDAEENILSISVSRHNNELFGTDQNGRQYVFKL